MFSISYHHQTIAILDELERLRSEAAKLNKMGMELFFLHKYQAAIFHYHEALNVLMKISEESQSYKRRMFSLHSRPFVNAKAIHRICGSLSQPIPIDPRLAVTDPDWERIYAITIMHNAALVHFKISSFSNAEKLLRLAITLVEGNESEDYSSLNKDPRTCVVVMSICHTLGCVLSCLDGRLLHEAMEFFKAAADVGKTQLGHHILVACVFATMGQILIREGYIQEAMGAFGRASKIYDAPQACGIESLSDVCCNGAAAA